MNDALPAREAKPLEGGVSFSLRNRLTRAVWIIVWRLFASWTPPFLHPWRRLLLRSFGGDIANWCDVRGSASVWYPANLRLGHGALIAERVNCYNMAVITLEAGALVSQGAYLCAGNHDIDDPHFQLIAKPIVLKSNCWIASEAFVAPGVTVGEGAVLGARGAAFRDLEAWTLYVGNPAHPKRVRRRRPRDHGDEL